MPTGVHKFRFDSGYWPLLTALLAALLPACRAAEAPTPEATPLAEPTPEGAVSAAAVALYDLDGRIVHPLAESHGTTVFVFVRSDCPISNRYAPEIRGLAERYAPRGASFRLVYPDPDATPAAIRAHLNDYGLPGDALRDPEHALVQVAQASVTPEAAVFLKGAGFVYVGRIDDRYLDFGKARPRPTSHDLAEALDAVLAGRAVKHPRARAVGCFIADMRRVDG